MRRKLNCFFRHIFKFNFLKVKKNLRTFKIKTLNKKQKQKKTMFICKIQMKQK